MKMQINEIYQPLSIRQINDYELIYMIHQGDEYSEKALLEKYRPFLRSLLRGDLVTKIPGYEVDDLVSILNLQLLLIVENYNESKDCAFFTYMRSCITNQIVSLKRTIGRRKRKAFVTLDIDYVYDNGESFVEKLILDPSLVDPEYYVEYRRLSQLTEQFVKGLSEDEKILWGFLTSNKSRKERAMGCNTELRKLDGRIYRLKKKFIHYLRQS